MGMRWTNPRPKSACTDLAESVADLCLLTNARPASNGALAVRYDAHLQPSLAYNFMRVCTDAGTQEPTWHIR
eukprot:6209001-Pleurochrysis_carterae.AAC.2